MTDFSNFLEDELLDHTLGVSAYPAVTQPYLALYTTDPGEGDVGTEVSGGGYARQPITFGAASSGTSSNTAVVEFTASGANFGTVTHVGIRDAVTGGNLLFHKALTSSAIVNDGDTLTFAIGDIDVTLD